MRAKMIASGLVLAAILLICAHASRTIYSVSEGMRSLTLRAAAAARNGDRAGATEWIERLQQNIDTNRTRLEVLAQHDDLNEICLLVIEAKVCLEGEEMQAFSHATAQILELLTVLEEAQRLSVGNLL